MHALLRQAVARTTGLLAQTEPIVWQTALNDFYVRYEMQTRLRTPQERFIVESELNGHTLDTFNEAGLQIMSPHFAVQPKSAVVARTAAADMPNGDGEPV